jgi:methylenetetrahydrofolate--tRNA-(uracil-5-)-methyltransferase
MSGLKIVGAGLAGTEAAWQAASQGIEVELYEMRPRKMTPAHKTGGLGELVCSNSLRGDSLSNAVGLLKEEMRRLDSLVMRAAEASRVPAGGALAVDRLKFSRFLDDAVASCPLITLIREEAKVLPEPPLIIAAGPLISPALSSAVQNLSGEKNLFFHDASAPLISAESINMSKAFFASRYGKGKDYLNCPLNKDEYHFFWQELKEASLQPLKDFEEEKIFEGCMPVEAMAKRGENTLRYGPLKPVGIAREDNERFYAVAQLRREDESGNMYNMVGFQTRLKWGEQQRVFRLIPGLEAAEFLRFGVMHRNTYINSPRLLRDNLSLKKAEGIFFAGQITGVEGYVESAACGLAAGLNAAAYLKGQAPPLFPSETALGALLRYICHCDGDFQPMNINFGLIPPLHYREKKKESRNLAIAQRSLEKLESFKHIHDLCAHRAPGGIAERIIKHNEEEK